MHRRRFLLGLAALPAACGTLRPVEVSGALERPHEAGYHHVGHGTHFLVWGALGVLTDPWLHEPADGLLRHRIPPAAMPTDPDIVLITHAHGDHYDELALDQLDKQAALVVPLPLLERASQLGFAEVIGASPGDVLEVRGLRVEVVAGAHEVAEICFRLEREGHSIFIAGDSALSDRLRAEAARRPADLCLLPGERSRRRGARVTMSPEEAVELAEAFGAQRAILTHHEAEVRSLTAWSSRIRPPRPDDFPAWFVIPAPGEFIPFPWDAEPS